MPNVARSRDAVTGRPAAGLVDQLTAGVIATASVRESLAAIEESGLRAAASGGGGGRVGQVDAVGVVHPPEGGENPRRRRRLHQGRGVPRQHLHPGICWPASCRRSWRPPSPNTPRRVAAVAAGLTDDDSRTLGSWDTTVRLPLARCTESGRIHLIVDGLDQPEPGARELILAALQHMTHTAPAAELGHVRVIAGVRGGENIDTRTELAHAHRIEVAAPGWGELAQAATTAAGIQISEDFLARTVGDATIGGLADRPAHPRDRRQQHRTDRVWGSCRAGRRAGGVWLTLIPRIGRSAAGVERDRGGRGRAGAADPAPRRCARRPRHRRAARPNPRRCRQIGRVDQSR